MFTTHIILRKLIQKRFKIIGRVLNESWHGYSQLENSRIFWSFTNCQYLFVNHHLVAIRALKAPELELNVVSALLKRMSSSLDNLNLQKWRIRTHFKMMHFLTNYLHFLALSNCFELNFPKDHFDINGFEFAISKFSSEVIVTLQNDFFQFHSLSLCHLFSFGKPSYRRDYLCKILNYI